MNVRPSILCPIDYSEASAAALRHAAAIAEHFVTRLIVLNVEDPMLTAAMDMGIGVPRTRQLSEGEISTFVSNASGDDPSTLAMCEYDVAVGKPSVEILRVARERSCDLIVMSSHGLSGARKLFFGSTTESVLRDTTIPVLVTPSVNPGPIHIEDAARLLGRVVVPVDLSPASVHQARVAGGLAAALNVPLTLMHVIEPVGARLSTRLNLIALDADRQSVAEAHLGELVAAIPRQPRLETLIVSGDPAEQVARVVRDRQAGLVVMGLHGMPWLGPRMGSVTYRILCLTSTLVLALPPKPDTPAHRGTAVAATLASEAVH